MEIDSWTNELDSLVETDCDKEIEVETCESDWLAELDACDKETDSLTETDCDKEIESETRDADVEVEKLWDCDADSDDVIFR